MLEKIGFLVSVHLFLMELYEPTYVEWVIAIPRLPCMINGHRSPFTHPIHRSSAQKIVTSLISTFPHHQLRYHISCIYKSFHDLSVLSNRSIDFYRQFPAFLFGSYGNDACFIKLFFFWSDMFLFLCLHIHVHENRFESYEYQQLRQILCFHLRSKENKSERSYDFVRFIMWLWFWSVCFLLLICFVEFVLTHWNVPALSYYILRNPVVSQAPAIDVTAIWWFVMHLTKWRIPPSSNWSTRATELCMIHLSIPLRKLSTFSLDSTESFQIGCLGCYVQKLSSTAQVLGSD